MLNTIIIEDEPYIRKALIALIESLNKPLTIVGECGSVQEAVTVVSACKPDIIFLDINLPDGNAFDFLKQTKNLNYKVIFITAYNEYALEALKQGAIDYILKPVDIEELEIAIDKAISRNSNHNKEKILQIENQFSEKIILRLQDGLQVIRFHELVYCVSDSGYTTFHLNNGKKYIASKPLKEFENLLPTFFFRTHQSYIVNLNFIEKYDKSGYVVLRDGKSIPVSVRKKDLFFEKFID